MAASISAVSVFCLFSLTSAIPEWELHKTVIPNWDYPKPLEELPSLEVDEGYETKFSDGLGWDVDTSHSHDSNDWHFNWDQFKSPPSPINIYANPSEDSPHVLTQGRIFKVYTDKDATFTRLDKKSKRRHHSRKRHGHRQRKSTDGMEPPSSAKRETWAGLSWGSPSPSNDNDWHSNSGSNRNYDSDWVTNIRQNNDDNDRISGSNWNNNNRNDDRDSGWNNRNDNSWNRDNDRNNDNWNNNDRNDDSWNSNNNNRNGNSRNDNSNENNRNDDSWNRSNDRDNRNNNNWNNNNNNRNGNSRNDNSNENSRNDNSWDRKNDQDNRNDNSWNNKNKQDSSFGGSSDFTGFKDNAPSTRNPNAEGGFSGRESTGGNFNSLLAKFGSKKKNVEVKNIEVPKKDGFSDFGSFSSFSGFGSGASDLASKFNSKKKNNDVKKIETPKNDGFSDFSSFSSFGSFGSGSSDLASKFGSKKKNNEVKNIDTSQKNDGFGSFGTSSFGSFGSGTSDLASKFNKKNKDKPSSSFDSGGSMGGSSFSSDPFFSGGLSMPDIPSSSSNSDCKPPNCKHEKWTFEGRDSEALSKVSGSKGSSANIKTDPKHSSTAVSKAKGDGQAVAKASSKKDSTAVAIVGDSSEVENMQEDFESAMKEAQDIQLSSAFDMGF